MDLVVGHAIVVKIDTLIDDQMIEVEDHVEVVVVEDEAEEVVARHYTNIIIEPMLIMSFVDGHNRLS